MNGIYAVFICVATILLTYSDAYSNVSMPKYCVDPRVLDIFGKRLECFTDFIYNKTSNGGLVNMPLKSILMYHADELRRLAGSAEFQRLHELYAYYWFVMADNPYRVKTCDEANLEFIPFLPLHYIAVHQHPTHRCSYKHLIDDVLEFMEYDKVRTKNRAERFLVASTFNMRTEMQRGLPSQERRGRIYDEVTSFVMGTYIGHYERFPQCPDTLRKGWKGIIEIPYIHLKAPTTELWQTAPRSLNSILFAGRMYLFGPERVCSVRAAIAKLAASGNDARQFSITVVNMTRRGWKEPSSQRSVLQRTNKLIRAEDMTTRLYGRHSFCLVTKGDSYSTSSLYMAIMSNCVPIVVGDWFVFAFNWVVAYDNFVVRVSEEDFLKNPEEALNFLISKYGTKQYLIKAKKEMNKWKKLLRYGIESWESSAAVQTRISISEKFPGFQIPSGSVYHVTIPPLELFLFELKFKGLEMTEMGSKQQESPVFTGNESLSCNTPFHCPPFAYTVRPLRFPGFSVGLQETRSELCRRAHGLIGQYKMVYFMGCVRILWPLRPGYFRPEVERKLSDDEKAFVKMFHSTGFSPEVYPPVPANASIIPFEMLV